MPATVNQLSERELAEKLVKIPEAEMQAYHKRRERNIRILYGFVVGIAIFIIVLVFLKEYMLAMVVSLGDLIFFRYAWYKRGHWRRLYENLLYLKRQRKDVIDAIEPTTKKYKFQKKVKNH